MKPINLLLRCYIVKREGHWEAFCIDLCLAAQADTALEAKAMLESQIQSYVEDALTVDREFAEQLLSRKAPLKQRLTYHYLKLKQSLKSRARGRSESAFSEAMPVHVGDHCHA